MILQSLKNLAEREGLLESPHYVPQVVHWTLSIGRDGAFLGFQPLGSVESDKRRSKGPPGIRVLVPRPLPGAARSGTAPDSGFLVENPSFLLGVDLTPEQKLVRRRGELERRHTQYRDLIERAAQGLSGSDIGDLAAFLGDDRERARAVAAAKALHDGQQLLANHVIAPQVVTPSGATDGWVHLLPAVVEYWGAQREQAGSGEAVRQCLITGRSSVVADKHPLIKSVPGGTPSGVSVVSFNSSAFESFGLQGNDNAPVSREAAEAYTTALNRLLAPSWPDPRQPTTSLPRQQVRLSADTAAVFWTEDASLVPAAIGPALEEGDPSAVAALGIELDPSLDELAGLEPQPTARPLAQTYEAPWSGLTSANLDELSPFRLLVLSGTQGRAIVRAFHTSTIRDTVEAVRCWFDDLRLVGFRGRPALWRLLASLAVRGERKNLPPSLAGDVFLAAISGQPLPRWVLEAAVRRARSESSRRVTPERAALIKAWLVRAKRNPAEASRLSNEGVRFQEVKAMLSDEEPNRGYLLGRLFACIERMQELALGDVGASVTDRYFASACATPQAVFPRLLKLEVHHFRKAREGRWPGSARYVNRLIDRLSAWLVGEQNGMGAGETIEAFLQRAAGKPLRGFPGFLPLPEQGLFTLGYHQQRAEFFKGRGSRASGEGGAEPSSDTTTDEEQEP